MYMRKGYHTISDDRGNTKEVEFKLDYIDLKLPIYLSLVDDFLSISVGPYIGIFTGQKNRVTTNGRTNISYEIREEDELDYGITLGSQITTFVTYCDIGFGIYYDIGFSNIEHSAIRASIFFKFGK